MTTQFRIQVPIRISSALHHRFASISKQTRIPMSILARDALERHLADIEANGIEVALTRVESGHKLDL